MPKVAAIQMCSSNTVDENLAMVASLLQEAAQQKAELVVLPEMFAVFSTDIAHKIMIKETYGHGKIQDFLAAQAAKHQLWIVAGTIPISCENPTKIRSACIVYDASGKAVARYDKMHLFDVVISETESYKESDTTEAGDAIVVVDTPIGKLGLAVCYDIRFPLLFNKLFKAGAEIIAIPAAFTVKTGIAHWHLLARSRAVENFCYVIGACQGGTHANGRKTYGHSLIVEPWGDIIAERVDPIPGVIYAEVDLKHLQKIRTAIPVGKHQKEF